MQRRGGSERVNGDRRVIRLSLLFALGVWFGYSLVMMPSSFSSTKSIIDAVVGTFFVALNVPLALLFRRALRDRRRRFVAIPVWTVAMLALQALAILVQGWIDVALFPEQPTITFALWFPTAIIMDSMSAVGLLLAVLAIDHYDTAARSAQRAEQLRGAVREQEMKALVAQLHPHFLFNTLNAIVALIRTDPAAARLTVTQLRTLIEQHIESYEPMWTVSQEMSLVRAYLDIEKRRFGKRLEVHLEVAPDVASAPFPRLLLQPLVENAVRHGVRGGGSVEVAVTRHGGDVHARVQDSGTFQLHSTDGTGVGLSNARSRLELLYGDRYRFDITPGDAGTTIDVRVPA
jgi:signal transduction histidine kinase